MDALLHYNIEYCFIESIKFAAGFIANANLSLTVQHTEHPFTVIPVNHSPYKYLTVTATIVVSIVTVTLVRKHRY